MDRHLAEHKTHQLPIILNLVLYNGAKPYALPTNFFDAFSDPDLARQAMLKDFFLMDFPSLSEEELSQHGKVALLEMLLKQGMQRDMCRWLESLKDKTFSVQILESEYLVEAFVYILAREKHSPEKIVNLVKGFAPSIEEKVMTAYQTIRQEGIREGMQQGMQQGIEKGIEQAAKGMLGAGMEPGMIARITGLSLEKIQQLKKG